MNENELRAAMRSVVVLAPPPPMSSAAAVSAGRRAARRRAGLTGAGAVAALVGVTAAGVNLGLPLRNGPDDNTIPVGAAATPSAVPTPTRSPEPSGGSTGPSWPADESGQPQEDATARSGKRYEQGRALLDRVLAAVPDGWVTPSGDAGDGSPLRYHQAQVEGDRSGSTWGYLAYAAVAKDGRTGRLLAEVHTAGNGLPSDPCALAHRFWGMGGDCEVVDTGKADVGVVVRPAADDRFDQWAAFRYPDGVVVYVAQSRNESNSGGRTPTSLTELPFSVRELAALATDESLHLE